MIYDVLLLMLCTFFKGLFLNLCTFFKGLFALFCHFFKGLSVAIVAVCSSSPVLYVKKLSPLGWLN